MFFTVEGRGMWMVISSMAGEDVVPVEEKGAPAIPRPRPAPRLLLLMDEGGGALADLPVKRGLSWRRTSKSDPVGPREVWTETVAGILSLGIDLDVFDEEKESSAAGPRRSTS